MPTVCAQYATHCEAPAALFGTPTPLPTHSMMMIMTLMNSGGDAVIGGNDDKHIHVILPCFYHTVNLVTIEVCIFPEEVCTNYEKAAIATKTCE